MGLPENIVYVRPLNGVPKRAPGKRLAAASGGKKTTQKSLQESLGQLSAE